MALSKKDFYHVLYQKLCHKTKFKYFMRMGGVEMLFKQFRSEIFEGCAGFVGIYMMRQGEG